MKDSADNKTIDAFEKKAMTNAERQRKYRENQRLSNNGSLRLDMHISKDAFFILEELCRLHGNTKKEFLENTLRSIYYKK